MIRLEAVTKLYPGAARPSVDRVDLAVEEGRTCVLIGPSGCGKTTTLRMVNRLIEPSSGRIVVAGRDVTHGDPVLLRRGIGYVIQGTGLFPHLSVGGNVATVPRLLGWDRARIAARTDAMLALVGLDPAVYRDRRPASLSGGQRQRVGVARALAADPPVMLMDEPFAAVDPVERSRLQREIASILRRLGKTVILVTHDIDEAIRMGDSVAVMREGHIVQHDAPDRLLAHPADEFVADFVGQDRALRRLTLLTAGEMATAGLPRPPGPEVSPDTHLQQALSTMLARGVDALALADGRVLTLAAIRERAAAGEPGQG